MCLCTVYTKIINILKIKNLENEPKIIITPGGCRRFEKIQITSSRCVNFKI